MTDDVFDLAEPRKLLTGIGTVALGGVATSRRTVLADARESERGVTAPSVCVFDVNETLLGSAHCQTRQRSPACARATSALGCSTGPLRGGLSNDQALAGMSAQG
jgi:hypothetical protein